MHRNHWLPPEEAILSGIYQCTIRLEGDGALLCTMYLMLITIWEILVMCLAGWVSVRHFRELRRHSAGGTIRDCFIVLMKSHIVYFARWVYDHNANESIFSRWSFAYASFVAVSAPLFGYLSPMVSTVCWSLIDLYMRARFIIFIGFICSGNSNLSWSSSNICTYTIIRAGTTPDSWCSRISC